MKSAAPLIKDLTSGAGHYLQPTALRQEKEGNGVGNINQCTRNSIIGKVMGTDVVCKLQLFA